MPAQGILHIHSAPPELRPHIEWAVAAETGAPAAMSWAAQPAVPGCMRAEFAFTARPGTAAAITSALAHMQRLRFDITEEPSPGCDGARYSYTPTLGTFTAVASANGDVLVTEARLQAVMATAGGEAARLSAGLGRLLGQPWDDELEPLRQAADSAPAPALTAVS